MEPVEGTHMQVRALSRARMAFLYAHSRLLAQALVLRRRAEAHEKLRDHASARADLDAAIALDAGNVDALLQRARLHREAGEFERCFLDVRAARNLDPQVSSITSHSLRWR